MMVWELDSRILNRLSKKCRDHVKSCWRDSDGYWVVLEEGWIFGSTLSRTESQDTLRDLVRASGSIRTE